MIFFHITDMENPYQWYGNKSISVIWKFSHSDALSCVLLYHVHGYAWGHTSIYILVSVFCFLFIPTTLYIYIYIYIYMFFFFFFFFIYLCLYIYIYIYIYICVCFCFCFVADLLSVMRLKHNWPLWYCMPRLLSAEIALVSNILLSKLNSKTLNYSRMWCSALIVSRFVHQELQVCKTKLPLPSPHPKY